MPSLRRSGTVRICRIAGVVMAHIYASPGMLTHALPAPAGDDCGALSIGLVGNQIADSVRLELGLPSGVAAHRSSIRCGTDCDDRHRNLSGGSVPQPEASRPGSGTSTSPGCGTSRRAFTSAEVRPAHADSTAVLRPSSRYYQRPRQLAGQHHEMASRQASTDAV